MLVKIGVNCVFVIKTMMPVMLAEMKVNGAYLRWVILVGSK